MSKSSTQGLEADPKAGVQYTTHIEPVAQGGKEYVRCEACGAELLTELGGRGKLVHRDGCPQA